MANILERGRNLAAGLTGLCYPFADPPLANETMHSTLNTFISFPEVVEKTDPLFSFVGIWSKI